MRFNSLLSLLFPTSCKGCRIHGTALCTTCLFKIPLAPPITAQTFAIYDYGNPVVQDAVWKLKYHHKSELIEILAHHGAPHISAFIGEAISLTSVEHLIFIPIPQHISKNHQRGFNQSTLIAKTISRRIPQSSVQLLLKKTIATLPQARISNKALRQKNVRDTMCASKILDPSTLYIIVDDVTTTGATFKEAVRALTSSGARKILCVALAHGYAHPKEKLV